MRIRTKYLPVKIVILIFKILILIYLIACLGLYIWQEKVLFLPEKLPENHQFRFQSAWIKASEEHTLLAQENGKINVVWLKTENPKGVIFYCHGNAGNIQRWANIVDDLMQHDYDIILWDYRTYGKSTGKLTEKNLLADGQLVYDFAKKHFLENQIVVYGRSLGTGVATYLSAANSPRCLILETPYFNLKDVAAFHFSYFPYSLLLRFELKTNEWIKEARCPTYIFHGTYDRTVPYKSGYKLAPLLKANDEFITLEAGDHNDLSTFLLYEQKIKEILEK